MTDVSAASNIQAADISPEEQNYLRIANLLLRVAPSSVRIKFDNELHPGGLNTVLNQNRFKILEPLKQKKIINQAQWDLLFPISGTPSSKTFDLTLMICLIRNLTNIEIGDAIPFSGNKTDGADLTRIKYYRNKIMHSIDGIFCQSQILKFGGMKYLRNDKEILTEIKNIIGTSDPIPKGLRNLWDKTILEWKKEQVAETRAITRLAEMIASDNVAVAVGPSGCGKSTAIHNIALQLALLHNYDIIIAYNPEDMRQLFNPDCKQVFVIDDILGVATFDENKARKWTEMSNDVNRILEDIIRDSIIDTCNSFAVYSPPPLNHSVTKFKFDYDEESISDPLNNRVNMPGTVGPITSKTYLKFLSSKKTPQFVHEQAYEILPIHIAVSKGYTDIVKLLLTHNAEPDYDTGCHQIASPLYIASYKGNTDIVKLLLENKPRTKVTVPTLQTVYLKEYSQLSLESSLHIAVLHGFYDIVRLLLIYKVDLYQYQEHLLLSTPHTKLSMNFYWNMVSIAIVNDHEEILKLLLEQDCNLNHNCDPNICDKDNKSPLFFASRWGHTQILKLLLAQNCDPNICNKDNESPLFVASQQGHTENVKLLLDYKCDPNICNKDNESALFVACSSFWNCTDIVKLLLDHKTCASKRCNIDIVKLLLDHKSDPNICNKNNKSPLFVACASKRCNIDIVKLLLDHKSDPNICNKNNKSPLFVACASKRCNIDIVKLLLDHKSDPNMCNKNNKSPLFVACASKRSCASIGLLDGFSKFVFHYDNKLNLPDTFQNHIEIMKLLLDHNCDPNICNKDNESPLFVASLNGYTEIVKLLINYSCDPNICNKDNESPLQAALRRNHTEIVDLLNNYHFVDICHDTTC
ncbi:unnamed protein product [Mytilus edulis]|uniref:DZIP3-like HEPN domain-containing protein n=1 Tax=Mytilus edulis TaxID=6550 RepID=A0A8S3RF17_MYTED|nr:unnamed protein product [Mytilus edulis]